MRCADDDATDDDDDDNEVRPDLLNSDEMKQLYVFNEIMLVRVDFVTSLRDIRTKFQHGLKGKSAATLSK